MAVTITNDAATTRTNLGLGDAATKTVGTASGNIPVLDISGDLPTSTYTNTDTVYTHPTTAGNKHIPTAGAADQVLTYSASGTATWADAAGGGASTDDSFFMWLNTGTAMSSNNRIPYQEISSGTNVTTNAAGYATVATAGTYLIYGAWATTAAGDNIGARVAQDGVNWAYLDGRMYMDAQYKTGSHLWIVTLNAGAILDTISKDACTLYGHTDAQHTMTTFGGIKIG